MLVLSRKKNDSIVINGNITIEVIQVKGKQVRLGIKAPRDVRILRGELASFDAYPQQESKVDVVAEGRMMFKSDGQRQVFSEKTRPEFSCELPSEMPADQIDEIDLMLDLAQLVPQTS